MSMTIQQLETLRDELKLKANLFSAEVRQTWEKVEKDFQLLQSEAKHVMPPAKTALAESAKVAQPLLKQLESSLLRIRDGFERNHLSP